MALRKELPAALELYRKMLVVFAGVAAVLPTLLNLTSFLFTLLAAVLVLLPVFLWKHTAVRVVVRAYSVLLTLAVPALCITLACMGYFLTEHLSLLAFGAVVLPAMAIAASHQKTPDIIMMQVMSLVNLVSTGLIIGYIIETSDWVKSVLLGATALVVFVLALMLRPPFFKKQKSNNCQKAVF